MMAGKRGRTTQTKKVESPHSNYEEDDENIKIFDTNDIIQKFSKRLTQQKKFMDELKTSYDFMSTSFDELKDALQKISKENNLMKKQIQEQKQRKIDG